MDTIAVPVATGCTSYEVLLRRGLLQDLPRLLSRYVPAHRYAIISDSTVEALYARDVSSAVSREYECELFVFPAGEASKTRDTWTCLTDRMIDAGFGRDSAIVAVGGGVTGDLAGFVAATFLRGIPYVQVPTTLLAMIDSSIGGKTAVDTVHGKNLVGAFHQPRLVVIDVSTLETLPTRHIRAGTAEAIKHGAIADADYFNWIGASAVAILNHDEETMQQLVRRSIEIKAGIVADDVMETGPRAALNVGHTIGHAIEAATEFEVLHGEAVAIGMVAEAALGTGTGITESGVPRKLRATVEALGLSPSVPDTVSADSLLELMTKDKKGRFGEVRFALLERVGKVSQGQDDMWTHHVPEDAIIDALSTVT